MVPPCVCTLRQHLVPCCLSGRRHAGRGLRGAAGPAGAALPTVAGGRQRAAAQPGLPAQHGAAGAAHSGRHGCAALCGGDGWLAGEQVHCGRRAATCDGGRGVLSCCPAFHACTVCLPVVPAGCFALATSLAARTSPAHAAAHQIAFQVRSAAGLWMLQCIQGAASLPALLRGVHCSVRQPGALHPPPFYCRSGWPRPCWPTAWRWRRRRCWRARWRRGSRLRARPWCGARCRWLSRWAGRWRWAWAAGSDGWLLPSPQTQRCCAHWPSSSPQWCAAGLAGWVAETGAALPAGLSQQLPRTRCACNGPAVRPALPCRC